MREPEFPPLLTGFATGGDPFGIAVAKAGEGCDPGLVVHRCRAQSLEAAIVLAPEVALEEAMAMLPLCAVALQNALGALGPPELPVHLQWGGGVEVNGAPCGELRAAAGYADAQSVPDWLVIALAIDIAPHDDAMASGRTYLHAEGCGDIDAPTLLESWARHTLVWIDRWSEEGVKPVHREWSGLASELHGEIEIMGSKGRFVGVDERMGMLLEVAGQTRLVPLSSLLKVKK